MVVVSQSWSDPEMRIFLRMRWKISIRILMNMKMTKTLVQTSRSRLVVRFPDEELTRKGHIVQLLKLLR